MRPDENVVRIKGGAHTKNEIEERRHRPGPAASWPRNPANSTRRECSKGVDDGVDMRLTSDKVAVGRRAGSLRVYAMDGTQVVSCNNCGSRIVQIDWDASSNISGAPRRRS